MKKIIFVTISSLVFLLNSQKVFAGCVIYVNQCSIPACSTSCNSTLSWTLNGDSQWIRLVRESTVGNIDIGSSGTSASMAVTLNNGVGYNFRGYCGVDWQHETCTCSTWDDQWHGWVYPIPPPACCTPSCSGKCGGADGCSGTCPFNCSAGQVCRSDTYTCCTPVCSGKTCGDADGCGGVCTAGSGCTAVPTGNKAGVVGFNGNTNYSAGNGAASYRNWRANTGGPSWMNPNKYSYLSYWKPKLTPTVTLGDSPIITIDSYPTGSVVLVQGNLTISSDQTLTGNKKIIFLVDGNLNINAKILRASKASFLGFLVGGDINVANTVAATDQTAPLRTGLVSYWKMDSLVSNQVSDSISGYTGTVTGGTAVTGQYINNSLYFGGSGSVTAGTPVSANMTLAAWLKIDISQVKVVVYYGNSGADGFGLLVSNGACGAGNIIGILLGGVSCNAAGSSTLAAGSWYHVAMTKSGNTWQLFVNGSPVGGPVTLAYTSPSSALVMPNSLTGTIDEVGIWNRVLTQSDIDVLRTQTDNNWVTGVGATLTSALDGFFLTDGTFNIPTGSSPLVGNGMFIAYNGFSFQRDLGSSLNSLYPAEKFYFDPSLVINAPANLMKPSYSWKEIAP